MAHGEEARHHVTILQAEGGHGPRNDNLIPQRRRQLHHPSRNLRHPLGQQRVLERERLPRLVHRRARNPIPAHVEPG